MTAVVLFCLVSGEFFQGHVSETPVRKESMDNGTPSLYVNLSTKEGGSHLSLEEALKGPCPRSWTVAASLRVCLPGLAGAAKDFAVPTRERGGENLTKRRLRNQYGQCLVLINVLSVK